jgi:predicted Fe-Mo cluster-binding NifX family protein
MRVLIPTNDGINISPDFDRATSFRFLTVINGSIKEDQFMNSSDIEEKGLRIIQDRIFKENLSARTNKIDPELRQVVITREISKESETSLLQNKYMVFHSGEVNIINAIITYLKDCATNESDYLCCP